MVNVEVAWVICSSVALSSQFKIKSPGLIYSEGRPARSMRRRFCVSHEPSQNQKGEFDLIKAE